VSPAVKARPAGLTAHAWIKAAYGTRDDPEDKRQSKSMPIDKSEWKTHSARKKPLIKL
jgi:hypothetical protein